MEECISIEISLLPVNKQPGSKIKSPNPIAFCVIVRRIMNILLAYNIMIVAFNTGCL